MMIKAAVIGNPIAQSKSPRIHNHWLLELGINGKYSPVLAPLNDFEGTVRGLIEQGFFGANVTIPFKEQALAIADERTPLAQRIGAANTLVFRDGRIIADNTDGYGFAQNILAQVPDWNITGSHIVLGAGGAARAVIAWLVENGAEEIVIINRNQERACELANMGNITVAMWDDFPIHLAGKTSLINTTSLGMNGVNDISINFTDADTTMIVNDIVYSPLETGLLRDAKAAGLTAVDGLGMLLWQARPGFAAWFGAEPPAIDAELREMMLK